MCHFARTVHLLHRNTKHIFIHELRFTLKFDRKFDYLSNFTERTPSTKGTVEEPPHPCELVVHEFKDPETAALTYTKLHTFLEEALKADGSRLAMAARPATVRKKMCRVFSCLSTLSNNQCSRVSFSFPTLLPCLPRTLLICLLGSIMHAPCLFKISS